LEGDMSAKQIYAIMDWCDDMFLAGRFVDVNERLLEVDVRLLCTDEILTYLTMSKQAEEHLPYRETFLTQAIMELEKRPEDYDYCSLEELLQGLF